MNPDLLYPLLVIFGPILAAVLIAAWVAHCWLAPTGQSVSAAAADGGTAKVFCIAATLAVVGSASLFLLPRVGPRDAEFVAFHFDGARRLVLVLCVGFGILLVSIPILSKRFRSDPATDPRVMFVRGVFCLVAGILVFAGFSSSSTALSEEGIAEAGAFGTSRASAWADLRDWFVVEGETHLETGEFVEHPHCVIDFEPGGRWTLGLRPYFELSERPECERVLRVLTGGMPKRVREAPPY